MAAHPTLEDILAAQQRIEGVVKRTPLVASLAVPVQLKLECRQETGSFKLRGAANRLLTMTDHERSRGVVAVSSGNHGRAVARVSADLGVDATICLSSRVPAIKVEAIESLGATVVVAGATQDDADAEARRLIGEEGLTLVHPFDDPMVIAGQGTTGLEILADRPGTDTVVVPMSGGGLIAGIAAAVKGIDASVRVIGVSQDRGPAMYLSIRAGHLVDVIEEDTLADALAGGLGPENHHSFEMCRDLVDESLLVTEDQIASAMAALYREDCLVVEGGGAVGVAAILAGKIEPTPGMVVVVSGGNVGEEALREVLQR